MKWSKEDLHCLITFYSTNTSIQDIASKLYKSKRAIYHKAVRLGLSRTRIPINRPIDRKHRNIYDKNYYDKNKIEIYKRKAKRIKNYKKELVLKLGGKCSICSYNKCIAALEFHHKNNDKENNVRTMIKDFSKEKALKEATKCILLCANCHRELHYMDP